MADKKSVPPFLSRWQQDKEEPVETAVDFATGQTIANGAA